MTYLSVRAIQNTGGLLVLMQENVFVEMVSSAIRVNIIHSTGHKSNHIFYTTAITPKGVTSGRAHFCGFAHGQHSSEETSQGWRAVGDTVFNLTGHEPRTSRAESNVVYHYANKSLSPYADWLF